MDISKKEIKKLNEGITSLNERMEKFTSFKYRFFLSILTGVGTAIGATIVAAILFALLSWVLQSLGGLPYLENLLEEAINGSRIY